MASKLSNPASSTDARICSKEMSCALKLALRLFVDGRDSERGQEKLCLLVAIDESPVVLWHADALLPSCVKSGAWTGWGNW